MVLVRIAAAYGSVVRVNMESLVCGCHQHRAEYVPVFCTHRPSLLPMKCPVEFAPPAAAASVPARVRVKRDA